MAAAVGAALFAALPYALSRLNSWVPEDELARMANVGEAYGGPSALLAGIAMIGVTAALVFQIRQYKTGQAIEIRKMQIELMRMVIDDPSLRPSSPNYPGLDPDARNRAIYSNLMFKYLELTYEIGYSSRESLEIELAEQFRIYEIGQVWRKARRQFEASASNRGQREFVKIVDRALAASSAERVITPAATPIAENDRRSPAHRWFMAGVVAGACVVTLSRGRSVPHARRP
ncbi:DUF6082 family protein [Asanoa iriomotensis]|uniref:DUF6082 family protein n=1 Tax=Asanoa iriomotensis TaxID=234613 RepID=UPI001943B7A0|nr:DUF6082 family protein [Asanoa iriomotensis]